MASRITRLHSILITILALTVALALHSAAQELARRLILKDGSYSRSQSMK